MRRVCLYRSGVRSAGMVRGPIVRLLAWTGILVLALPAAAHADGIFTPFIGMSARNDQSERVRTYGASLAGMAGGIFGFELDYGRTAAAQTDSLVMRDSRVTTMTGNVIIGVPFGRVRPYAVGGLGWLRNEVMDDSTDAIVVKDDGIGIDIGGGLMGFLTDRIGARVDLRYVRAVSAGGSVLDFELTRFSFWRFSGGVAVRF